MIRSNLVESSGLCGEDMAMREVFLASAPQRGQGVLLMAGQFLGTDGGGGLGCRLPSPSLRSLPWDPQCTMTPPFLLQALIVLPYN